MSHRQPVSLRRELKPLEIEIIVAEVGDDRWDDHRESRLYRVTFDGFISDHTRFCVIGGNVDEVESIMSSEYRDDMDAGSVLALGVRALEGGAERSSGLDATSLEVSTLKRSKSGRKFERLSTEQVRSMLGGE